MNADDEDDQMDMRQVIRNMEGAVTDDEDYDDNNDIYLPDIPPPV